MISLGNAKDTLHVGSMRDAGKQTAIKTKKKLKALAFVQTILLAGKRTCTCQDIHFMVQRNSSRYKSNKRQEQSNIIK